MRWSIVRVVGSALVLATAGQVWAAPIQWADNEHYYDLIPAWRISWPDAISAAETMTFEGLPGHLATITSAAENVFINVNFNTGQSSQLAWIGGHEPNDDGVWRWAAGPDTGGQFANGKNPTPPFNYANWGGVEPNDRQATEDYASYNVGRKFGRINPGEWADSTRVPTNADPIIGYLVEYEEVVGPTTHVLAVGVNWPADNLLGGEDAKHLASALKSRLSGFVKEPVVRDYNWDAPPGQNLGNFRSSFEEVVQDVAVGDTLILSLASHGDSKEVGSEPDFWTSTDPRKPYLEGDGEWRSGNEYVLMSEAAGPIGTDVDRLYDDELHALLADERLDDVKKIVIFDACRSGGFGPDLGFASGIPNIAVLAGSNEGYFTFSAGDGTGIFTNALIQGLNKGPDGFSRADTNKDRGVSLIELEDFTETTMSWDPTGWGGLIGEELPLRLLQGSGVFYGLDVEFSASADFTGGFSVPEPSTLVLLSMGAVGLLVYALRKRK